MLKAFTTAATPGQKTRLCGENADCLEAVKRFINAVNLSLIEEMVNEIPESAGNLSVMPEAQKNFYLKLMKVRLGKLNI